MKKITTVLFLLCLSSLVFAQTDGDNTLFGARYIYKTANATDSFPSGNGGRSMTFIPGSMKLNGTDLAHVLVSSYTHRIFLFQQVSKTSLDFKLVWVSPAVPSTAGVTGSNPRCAEVLNDIDGNGKPELAFLLRGSLRDTVETDSTVKRGIRLYEWDGVTGSNNYKLVNTIRLEDYDAYYKTSTLGSPEKGSMSSSDVDGDGKPDLILWPGLYGFNSDITKNGGKLFIFGVESGTFANKNAKVKLKYVYTKMAKCLGDSDGFVPYGHVTADVDGDGKKEIVVFGRQNIGYGGGVGFIKFNSQTGQFEDGNIVDLTDYSKAAGTYRNLFRVTAVAGVMPWADRDVVIFNADDNNKRVLLLSDIIDIGLVTINNFTVIKDLPDKVDGDYVGTAIGDQDHGTGKDGFDVYFPSNGSVLNVGDLEYKGTGNIADSNNYTYYNKIFDVRTILKSSVGSGGIYHVTVPGYDIDGNGKKEIICNFQTYGPDTTVVGNYPLYSPPVFWILEWGTQSIPTVEVRQTSIFYPEDYKLEQNYPNPFNPTTNIKFSLPVPENISLIVYDMNGREVRKLIDGKLYEKGSYEITWDAKDNYGKSVSTGNYFYKLIWGNFEKSMKMTLLK